MPRITHWNACTPYERIERWEKAIEYLEAMDEHAKKKHFDMAYWGYKSKCGTVACAAGHLGLMRWFRQRGLKLNVIGDKKTTEDEATAEAQWPLLDPDSFFGPGADAIFYDHTKRSMQRVIEEMRAYLFLLRQGDGAADVEMDKDERNKLSGF